MLEELSNRVARQIAQDKEELFSLIQEIVRIPSVCGQEWKAQEWIASKYREIGLKVDVFQAERNKVKDHRAFIDAELAFDGRPNVIGILEGNSSNKSLTLNGHIDVVSPEPLASWNYDPWGAEIVGNRLYGRGAADMKGGLIANYFALKKILELGIKPQGTVMLQSVVEEEAGGGAGTLACLLEGYRTDGFLASEPHALRLTVGHAGILYFRVKLRGVTAHAGLAHLGINAIGKMVPIYEALIELDAKRGNEIKFDLFARGSGRATHLNIGKFTAGDWPSTVAGWAQMECRLSFVPGEKMEDIKAMIEKLVADVADKDSWLKENPPEVEWFGWHTDPWYQDPENEYVRSFKESAEKILSREIEIIGRASGNDARFTQYFPGCAGICCGPDGANIHGIDEYLDLDSVVQTSQILAVHIMDWCGIE